ncbi:MAG: reverse transcriptase domain-containing protein, partial [Candidatus Thiodiazotropha endolucinida]|nr:hypothetical protein [Candidatus Thiodiazotropha taylori]MCW4344105.1 reverse transcriptase domain-containing protein [Candidatus Thiodiazotropha endolucinida]
RKQRGQLHKCIDELHVGDKIFPEDSILSGFYEHFKELASNKPNQDFDNKYLNLIEEESAVIYMICSTSNNSLNPVTDKEIQDAAKSLNRGKAADVYGVTAEHIYHGGPILLNTVKSLTNTILVSNTVPASLKLGILNPVYKNKGNIKDSQYYRGITITPVLTRLIEAILKARIKPALLSQQNAFQRGFTENSSPMNCSLIVEEFYRNNRDLSKPTYIGFMDAKSAFDVVIHSNLMRRLYNVGVEPNEWLTINSLHHNSLTAVKWKGELSSTFVNCQGVRQGGVLSADLYKLYNNPLLDRIKSLGIGARIGDIDIQAPTCADDLTVLSNNPYDLQLLFNVCKDFSNMEGYVLHDLKSVVLKMNSIRQYPSNEEWDLDGKPMPVVNSVTHMGIRRSSANQELHAVEHNIQKARRTAYSLMGAGLHGENGLDPETSVSLLNTYVFPIMLYGLEVIVPTGKAFELLDKQYKKILKHVLSVPINVADPAIYLLSGALPVEALLHKRMLSLFGNISRLSDGSIERRLAKRQLELKSFNSHSWFIAVKKVLIKYDLPDPEVLLNVPISKCSWKQQYNKVINKYWRERILSQSILYSSLKYLAKLYTVGRCHPAITPYQHSNRDINRIPTKCKVITGTYILQTNRAKFNQNNVNPTCLLCGNDDETMKHFLLDCSYLDKYRKPILQDINDVLSQMYREYPFLSRYTKLQLVIDGSIVLTDCADSDYHTLEDHVHRLSYHSRRLLYTLHAIRYKELELSVKKRRTRSRRHT